MKVSHKFLKGELVLLIRVQNEKDRKELEEIIWCGVDFSGPISEECKIFTDQIFNALDSSRLAFMTCKTEER